MKTSSNLDMNIVENRFWLQIMGDHARFIFFSLAPSESEYITIAQEFIRQFDKLLEESQKLNSLLEMNEFNRKTYDAVFHLRDFKLELLSMSLQDDLISHLSPAFYNYMLNELEEYLHILNLYRDNISTLLPPLHYHLIWLNDAAGHAGTLTQTLDPTEKGLINQAYDYQLQFQDLFLKSYNFSSYQKTAHESFPVLDNLNQQVIITLTGFTEFLDKLRDQRMDKKVLGTLMPLMADHMSREECYYLWKLSMTAKNVRKPDCGPDRPRLNIM